MKKKLIKQSVEFWMKMLTNEKNLFLEKKKKKKLFLIVMSIKKKGKKKILCIFNICTLLTVLSKNILSRFCELLQSVREKKKDDWLVVGLLSANGTWAYRERALRGGLSKGSAERLGRQAWPGFERSTSCLPVLSVTTPKLVGQTSMEGWLINYHQDEKCRWSRN